MDVSTPITPARVIRLTTLPPVSANAYWRTAVRAGHAVTYVSAEAKEFKADVRQRAFDAGIWEPLKGRVEVFVQLYPARPQDWARRMRREGAAWSDGIRCLDVDNANKVLLDAIKGVVIEDDKWVWKLSSQRMEPDEHGARAVLFVRQMSLPVVQGDLLGAAA